ncbi:MAG: adenosylmethionine--8-amino-7-oxononanoate transaminase [Smithellaceae bacterium]|nr:adenosylmethionine--8-amino-7-oxononanoate transaminase [Smithellaceae bacterium]
MTHRDDTSKLRELDRKHIWHPFTQMQDWRENDFLIIERGKGSYLYDTEGKKYLDGVSSLWVNVHGHRKKELDRAMKRQLGLVAHSTFLGLSNVPAIRLAEELVGIAPAGLNKVYYSDNGSTAVEIALKMAYQYWQHRGKKKNTFITFTNAYHGDTIGSVSVGGIDIFHQIFQPLLFPTHRTHSPYCYRCPLGKSHPGCRLDCLDQLDGLLREESEEIAAVILEPEVQGAAGMITQPEGFVRRVRDICDRHQTLLIFDEVATGFGRTGKMFASEHSGVSPDLLAVAKGITGGYLPLAATLVRDEIYEAFLGKYEENKAFFHGHTYTANPLACEVARENIRLLKEDHFLDQVADRACLLAEGLGRFQELTSVGQIRQRGLMAGIELVADKTTKEEIPSRDKAGIRVIRKARELGAILRPLGNAIVLMPPLSISRRELKKLLEIAFASIRAFERGDV